MSRHRIDSMVPTALRSRHELQNPTSINRTPPPLIQLNEIPHRIAPRRAPLPPPDQPAPHRDAVVVEAGAAGRLPAEQLAPRVDPEPDVRAPAKTRAPASANSRTQNTHVLSKLFLSRAGYMHH